MTVLVDWFRGRMLCLHDLMQGSKRNDAIGDNQLIHYCNKENNNLVVIWISLKDRESDSRCISRFLPGATMQINPGSQPTNYSMAILEVRHRTPVWMV